jgi:hypothetical protein
LAAGVACLRNTPQVLPPNQLVRLGNARILKGHTGGQTAVVLLLEHTVLHNLSSPEYLPSKLWNVLVAIRVLSSHCEVELLVNVQVHGVDASHHLCAVAIQRLHDHIRVVAADLTPVAEVHIASPTISELIHKLHVDASVVAANRLGAREGVAFQLRNQHASGESSGNHRG